MSGMMGQLKSHKATKGHFEEQEKAKKSKSAHLKPTVKNTIIQPAPGFKTQSERKAEHKEERARHRKSGAVMGSYGTLG